MKILQIVDVPYWAIGHLAASIVKHNQQFDFRTVYVHPKHVEEHMAEVSQHIEWADVIDYQYWNTAKQLMDLLPELKMKPSILAHHNEKDLLSGDWSSVTLLVAETEYSRKVLEEKYPGRVRLVPLAVDPNHFEYIEKQSMGDRPVIGYAGRVVPWKGLKELAEACYELGYTLKMMGKFDKPDYWNSIAPEVQANIDLEFLDCKDNERVEYYTTLDVFVNNSGPGRETGTLPLMEAMASGVPVITTASGIAADICEDQENAIVTPFNDKESLKNNLRMLVGNADLREKIRRAAWNTIKNFTEERRAWEYQKLFHEAWSSDPLVSVIIPTTMERIELAKSILLALEKSDYSHIEAVVIIDQFEIAMTPPAPDRQYDFPVKFLTTELTEGYNLAMARNLGVIEAAGTYLMFCDNRMCPQEDAIEVFVSRMQKLGVEAAKKAWLFGNKGTGKLTFVENFSFIRRDSFIRAGMCNERIDRYGGMSQELRTRFLSQGFDLQYVDNAKATQIGGSHLSTKRRADIVASKLKLFKMGMP